MRIFTLTAILTILAMLGGCSTVQKIQKIDRVNFNNVCIVEHTAVKEGVLEAIKETLSARGIKTHVVAGSYVKTNNMWLPSYQLSEVATCDAVLFYVAN